MAMIQGIDGATLINALRAGREDRFEDDRRKAEMANAEAEGAHRQRVQGLLGQLFGADQQPQGVAAQFGMQPGQAGSTAGMGPTEGAPIAPPAAVSPPPMATAPRRQANPDVLRQLVVLDPEVGGRIATALKSINDDELEQAEARNSHMGATAHWLRRFPPQERAARFQAAAPLLMEHGFTEEQLAAAAQDLSDERLGFYEANAIDYDRLIDNERAEREDANQQADREADNRRLTDAEADRAADRAARRGETRRHNEATERNTRRGQDRPRTGRSGGGSTPRRTTLPLVRTPAEAARLPSGTQFRTPDGKVRRVP